MTDFSATTTKAAMSAHGPIVLLTSESNEILTRQIGTYLGVEPHVVTQNFSNGETGVRIPVSVRDCDVYVVQSTSSPNPNDNFMALCIMLQAAKLAHPHRITAVVPCYGYARQDRKAKAREPITARLCAEFIATAGASRIITIDLHADQICGFFSIAVDHLTMENIFVRYIKENWPQIDDIVVVAPDAGGVKRARDVANKIGCGMALIHKYRPRAGEIDATQCKFVGDAKGKVALLIDDMIDTAGTLCNAARMLVSDAVGATKVVAFATHGVLSGAAYSNIAACDALQIIVIGYAGEQKERAEICCSLDAVFACRGDSALQYGRVALESVLRRARRQQDDCFAVKIWWSSASLIIRIEFRLDWSSI
jgi:ribose-phosphate pyrophosphokinase